MRTSLFPINLFQVGQTLTHIATHFESVPVYLCFLISWIDRDISCFNEDYKRSVLI